MGQYEYAVVDINEGILRAGDYRAPARRARIRIPSRPDVRRSSDAYDDALLPDVIQPALEAINRGMDRRAIEAAIAKLKDIEDQTLSNATESSLTCFKAALR